MAARFTLTEAQNKESCKALDFYGIKHQGVFYESHAKDLEKARLQPSLRMKQYAHELHKNIGSKIGQPLNDPYAPPGPDSNLWIGSVYKDIPGL